MIASPPPAEAGAGFATVQPEAEGYSIRLLHTKWPKHLPGGHIQFGLLKTLRQERPDAVITFANPRFLSFWTLLLWCRRYHIALHLHGHGLYKQQSHFGIPKWKKWVYQAICSMARTYICYSVAGADSLHVAGVSPHKICVAENSVTYTTLVSPDERTGGEPGILFIGRLRPDSRVQDLIAVVQRLRVARYPTLQLHIIGSGNPEIERSLQQMCAQAEWLHCWGKLYDEAKIADISRKCSIGCYPGNVGLSVLHLMSLSLVPVIHNRRDLHGPEAEYVTDGVTGCVYEFDGGADALADTLDRLLSTPDMIKKIQKNTFDKYHSLVTPTLAQRLWNIIEESV